MSLIDRYIATRILRGIFTAFVVVTAVIMLVDFVEATRSIGEDGDLSLLTILILTALKAPTLIEETIPFVVLFGVMGALYGLNKRSELIVLRASGLSAWRFLWPAVKVTTLLGVIWAAVFNPLASKSMERYQTLLTGYTMPNLTTHKAAQIWLREGSETGQTVIRGTLSNPGANILDNATFYYYDYPDAAQLDNPIDNATARVQTLFSKRIDAERAILLSTGYWQLENLTENSENNGFSRDMFASFPTSLGPSDLQDHRRLNMRPPFWKLPNEISRTEEAGFSAVGLRMQFHRLLCLPLALIAMTFIAAGVSMHLTRAGGSLPLMLSGATVGFGVYFINNLMNAFGEAQSMPILMAAWTVPVLVLICGIAYLTKTEDG